MNRIDHTGIIVRSIQEHFDRYLSHLFSSESLGPSIHDPLQKVNVAFIDVPGGRIELVELTAPDSPVAEFAKKSPAGYHHICLEVDDLDKSLQECRKAYQVVVSAPQPAVAFDNRRIAFVAGRDRLLWELLEGCE